MASGGHAAGDLWSIPVVWVSGGRDREEGGGLDGMASCGHAAGDLWSIPVVWVSGGRGKGQGGRWWERDKWNVARVQPTSKYIQAIKINASSQ